MNTKLFKIFLSKALFTLCISAFIAIFTSFNLFAAEGTKSAPKRIISLGPGITENLYLLEIEEYIIANTLYCKESPKKQKIEKIGTVTNFDLEKVVSLKPDLVLAIGLSNSRQIAKLKRLGVNTARFYYPKSFFNMCTNLLEIGKLVGKKKKAQGIIKKAQSQVEIIRKKTSHLKKPTIFVQIGKKPLFTVNKESFINDFIEFAGGINIAKEEKFGLYSRENVLKINPDIIIISTMGLIGEEEKKLWEKYKSLKAVRNKRIYIFDEYKLCSPTVAIFPQVLQEIARLFYPENKTL
ncbi:ABC transporter substrate-binding protein [Candidatus Auribacterota bacterium]